MDVVRKIRFALVSLIALSVLSACGNTTQRAVETFPKATAQCTETAIPNQFLVHYKNGTTVVHRGGTREQLLRQVIEPHIDEIEFAEHDQRVQLARPMDVTGSSSTVVTQGANDWWHQITESPNAWSRGFGGQGVIVAVIDSGVDRTHPSLRAHLAINAGESGVDSQGRDKSSNGVDDDSNGLTDDVSGYDFSTNSSYVTDGSGHGTHVAGIVVADHSGTVYGVAPNAKILPLDFMSNDGAGSLSNAIRAIYYAADQGAKVINASWGGEDCSRSLRQAILDVGARGVLFVAASGNEYRNLDSEPMFPAAYGISTQITVGASSMMDNMEAYSNSSYTLVNIMAPGAQIYSTYMAKDASGTYVSTYRALSGTSMASPFVAAAAAVLWSAKPTATVAQIKAALLGGVDIGRFEVSSRGRLNLHKALDAILAIP